MRVNVDTKAIDKAVRNLTKGIKKPRPAFDKIADNEIRKAQYRIRTSKMDPEGRPWIPRKYPSKGSLMYVTGVLHNSFKKMVNNWRVIITNTAHYAKYHQNGTWKLPRRQFLGWGRDSNRDVTQIFIDYLKKKLR